MKGFDETESIDVDITHGDKTVTYTLYALPPGWRTWLQTRFPQPTIFVRGKGTEPDPAKRAEYWDQYSMLCLGKSMEAAGGLETTIDAKNAAGWGKVARDLFAEAKAAGLSDGDLSKLLNAMKSAFIDEAPAAGN